MGIARLLLHPLHRRVVSLPQLWEGQVPPRPLHRRPPIEGPVPRVSPDVDGPGLRSAVHLGSLQGGGAGPTLVRAHGGRHNQRRNLQEPRLHFIHHGHPPTPPLHHLLLPAPPRKTCHRLPPGGGELGCPNQTGGPPTRPAHPHGRTPRLSGLLPREAPGRTHPACGEVHGPPCGLQRSPGKFKSFWGRGGGVVRRG